jgi:hypothetical protein
VNKVKDSLVVTIKIPSDLSGLRSHLLDHVEEFFKRKAMLAENRVCEVVEICLTVLASILLGVFPRSSSLDYCITPAVDTRHRLAEASETETLNAALS